MAKTKPCDLCPAGSPLHRSDGDVLDHKNEVHDVYSTEYGLSFNKMKRKKIPHLVNTFVQEAGDLNILKTRIMNATEDLRLMGVAIYDHNLYGFNMYGFGFHQPDAVLALHVGLSKPQQRLDLAQRLVALRQEAGKMGVLQNGSQGTFEQVALDLEVHAATTAAAAAASSAAGASAAGPAGP